MKRVLLGNTPFPGRMPDPQFDALNATMVETIRSDSPLCVRSAFSPESLAAIASFLGGLAPERDARLSRESLPDDNGSSWDYILTVAGCSLPDGLRPIRTAVTVSSEEGHSRQDYIWQDTTVGSACTDHKAGAIALAHALAVARNLQYRTGRQLHFKVTSQHAKILDWITGVRPVDEPDCAVSMLRAGFAERLLNETHCTVAFSGATMQEGLHATLLCVRARAAGPSVPFKLETFRRVCTAQGLTGAQIWSALREQEVNYSSAEILSALHRVGASRETAMRIIDGILLTALNESLSNRECTRPPAAG